VWHGVCIFLHVEILPANGNLGPHLPHTHTHTHTDTETLLRKARNDLQECYYGKLLCNLKELTFC